MEDELRFKSWNLMPAAGHEPRDEEQQRRAARPRRVLESRPQNPDSAGAGGEGGGGGGEPVYSSLRDADQVLQTGDVCFLLLSQIVAQKLNFKASCSNGDGDVLFGHLKLQGNKEVFPFNSNFQQDNYENVCRSSVKQLWQTTASSGIRASE